MTTKFAAIVTAARQDAGLTAAEFDYQLQLGTELGWAAHNGLGNAIYQAAGRDLEAAEALRAEVGPEIDAMIEAAKTKSYTGWSDSSRGPVRYAR